MFESGLYHPLTGFQVLKEKTELRTEAHRS